MFVLFCVLVFVIGVLIATGSFFYMLEEGQPTGIIGLFLGAFLAMGSFNIETNTTVDELQEALGQSRVDFRQLADKHHAVNQELIVVQNKYKEEDRKNIQLTAQNKELNTRVETLFTDKLALESKVEFMTAEMESYETDFNEAVQDFQKSLGGCKVELEHLQNENFQLQDKADKAEAKLDKLKSLARGIK